MVLAPWHPQVVQPGDLEQRVSTVTLLEHEVDIDRCPAGSVAVLSRSLAATVRRYRVDVLIARAQARRVAGVLLPTSQQLRLPRDTRPDLAILTVDESSEVGPLVVALAQATTDEAGLAVAAARSVLTALPSAGSDPEHLIRSLRAAVPEAELGPVDDAAVSVRSTHPDDLRALLECS